MLEGILTPALRDIEYLAPCAPYPRTPSGITVHEKTIYRYSIPTEEQPNLIIVNYIPDYNGNFIKPGHDQLALSDDKEFLEKVGILDKEGNEFIKSESKKIFKFSDKHKKWIKIISIIVLSWTVLQHILMISKYGLDNMISITLNFILFVISLLLIIQE